MSLLDAFEHEGIAPKKEDIQMSTPAPGGNNSLANAFAQPDIAPQKGTSTPQITAPKEVAQTQEDGKSFLAQQKDYTIGLAQAIPEAAVGAVGFLPSIILGMGARTRGAVEGVEPGKIEERVTELQHKTHQIIRKMLFLPEETDERAQLYLDKIEPIFAAPRKYIAEPLGKAYTLATGSETGGKMTEDAVELLFWFGMMPKIQQEYKVTLDRHKARVAKRRATRDYSVDSFADLAQRNRLTIPAEAKWSKYRDKLAEGDKARQAREVRIEEGKAGLRTGVTRQEYLRDPLTVNEIFGEQGKAEHLQFLEHEARQQYYDRLFSEKNVNEFLDSVEGELKARDNANPMDQVALDKKMNDFFQRKVEKDLTLQKDHNRWQEYKRDLETRGLPTTDFLGETTGMLDRAGTPMNIKYGVEAGMPWPKETAKPLIEVPEQATLLKDVLGHKKDHSLKKKMALRKRKPERDVPKDTPKPTPEKPQTQKLVDMAEEIVGQEKKVNPEAFKNEQPVESVVPKRKKIKAPETEGEAAVISMTEEAKMELIEERLALMKERKKEGSGPTEAELGKEAAKKEVSPEVKKRLQVVDDMLDFMEGRDAPDFSPSPFHESMYEPMRDISHTVKDFNDFLGDRGAIGKGNITTAQQAAINRLTKDLMTIKRNAAQAGKDIATYLVDLKVVDAETARLFQKHTEQVLKKEDDAPRFVKEQKAKPPKGEKEPYVGNADKVDRHFEATEKAMAETRKEKVKKGLKSFKRALFDRSEGVRDFLEKDPSSEAFETLNAFRAVPSYSANANRYWNATWDKIFKPLTKHELKAVDRMTNVMKNLEIASRKDHYRLGKDVRPEDFRAWLDQADSRLGLTESQARKVRQAVEDVFDTYKDLLEMKYKNGSIPDWLYSELKEYNYAPTRWLHLMDAYEMSAKVGGELSMRSKGPQTWKEFEDIVNRDMKKVDPNMGPKTSGVERLQQGQSGYQNLNTQDLLSTSIAMTHRWVANNKASQSLGRLAEIHGHSGEVIRLADPKVIKFDKDGNVKSAVYGKPPKGYNPIHFFDQGVRNTIYAKDWFANQWSVADAKGKFDWAHHLRWFGGPVLREFATGALKPFFWKTGLPMDIGAGFMNTMKRDGQGGYKSLYSTDPIVYTGQVVRNIAKVMPDVVRRKGVYEQAINEGLDFGALSGNPSGRLKAHGKITEGLQKAREFGSYMNHTMEYAVRLAHREEYIKAGYTPKEATIAARDVLDYRRGGDVAKAIDNFLPYTNVAAQASLKLYDSIKKNPQEAAVKIGKVMGFASAYYAFNKWRNPDAVMQENDYNKNNYWPLYTGYSFKDDLNNEHHVNLLIRKEPSHQAFITLAETATALAMGEEYDFRRAFLALKDSVPYLDGAPLAPLPTAILTYATNTDLHTWQEIEHGVEKGAGNWDPRTSQMWKDLGETFELNPMKFKAATEVFTGRDHWLMQLVGGGYDMAFRELPQIEQDRVMTNWLMKNYDGQLFSVTSKSTEYRDEFDDIDIKDAGKRYLQNKTVDLFAHDYFISGDKQNGYEGMIEFVQSQPLMEQERLTERFVNFGKTLGLPEQRMWMNIAGAPSAKAKAKKVWNWMNSVSESEQQVIWESMGQLAESGSGIIPKGSNEDFWIYLGMLQQGMKVE